MSDVITTNDLGNKTIAQLRQLGSKMGLPIPKAANKEQIIGLIQNATNGAVDRIVGVTAPDRPLPGWARIEIQRNPDPRGSNADVYVQVNGYAVLIRRGEPVDVPIKILRGGLMNAKMEVSRQDDRTNPPTYVWEMVYSYPFNVLDINEGPDPRPKNESVAEKRGAPRRRFWMENGYWPKPKELKEWLSNGGGRNKSEG
jgi:hypothetical protein